MQRPATNTENIITINIFGVPMRFDSIKYVLAVICVYAKPLVRRPGARLCANGRNAFRSPAQRQHDFNCCNYFVVHNLAEWGASHVDEMKMGWKSPLGAHSQSKEEISARKRKIVWEKILFTEFIKSMFGLFGGQEQRN